MITAQDIREKTFEKARKDGYDMAAVDEFLEKLADEIAAAQKENAVLKSKMKVLVDKIEEYRSNEEALNLALLSAQKTALQIEAEAKQRAAALISDAEAKAQAVIGSIDQERINHEQRLADAKVAKARYIAEAKALCQAQMDRLSSIDVGEPLPAKDVAASAAEPAAPAADPAFDVDFPGMPETPDADPLDSTQTFSF